MSDARLENAYFWAMFIRKKKNRSGTTSVVVANKTKAKFKEVKVFGVSDNNDMIEALFEAAKIWVSESEHGLDLLRTHQNEVEEKQLVSHLLTNIV